jgi:1-acyl-sn-glycerol-3-phosphate acyltransferase
VTPLPRDLLERLRRPAGDLPWGAPAWPAGLERPVEERPVGVGYDGSWSRRYPARLARALALDNLTRPAVRVLASPTLRGAEQLDALDAPVIFASNHASHLDTPLLLCCLPARFRHHTVVGAAADHFFDRRWKAALWSFSVAAIPIERQRVSRRSVDLAAGLVEDGWNLVIFPEGGRSPDGWAQPFTGGAAYLSMRTGAPVVPVHLGGTRQVHRKGGRRIRPARTRVTFGRPLRPSGFDDARQLAARIEASVAALAEEVSTDWWSAARRSGTGGTAALHGPEASSWRRSWALGGEDRAERASWPAEVRPSARGSPPRWLRGGGAARPVRGARMAGGPDARD